MLRVLLVFIILVTLVLFPARSWLCQSTDTAIRVVISPCDDTVNIEVITSATGINVFSLLAPTLDAVGLNVVVSTLAHLPLLNPQQPVQPQEDPPPRRTPLLPLFV